MLGSGGLLGSELVERPSDAQEEFLLRASLVFVCPATTFVSLFVEEEFHHKANSRVTSTARLPGGDEELVSKKG